MSDDDLHKLIGPMEEKEMVMSAFVAHIAEQHGDFLRGLSRADVEWWIDETHGDGPCRACAALLGAWAVVHGEGAG
jgi:hypothetical protein